MAIKEIKSKITGETLHMVYSPSFKGRTNIVDESNLLQVAEINLDADKTFPAHKHLPTKRETVGTSEMWIVMEGFIKAYYYDLDDSLLEEVSLSPGDITITIKGGHTYKSLSRCRAYEIKNGPYMGIEKDKEFIL